MLDIEPVPTFISSVRSGLRRIADVTSVEYFMRLMNVAEVSIKSIASAMYAVTAPYMVGNELKLVYEQDGLGGWVQLLDKLCSPLNSNCDGARELQQWITQKRGNDSWFVNLRTTCINLLKLKGLEIPASSNKILAILQGLVQLRNKTTGHGALYSDFSGEANGLLEDVIAALLTSCPAYSWRWVVPHRQGFIQLNGPEPSASKFQDVQFPDHYKDHLCVIPKNEVVVYSCQPMIFARKEGTEFYFLNGAVRNSSAEYLNYANGATQTIGITTGKPTATNQPPMPKSIEPAARAVNNQTVVELEERRRNLSFVGRADIFQEISSTYSSTNLVALFGVSGVGKSEIATEYYYRNSEKYDHVIWLQADADGSLNKGSALLAARLIPAKRASAGSEDPATDIRQWLQQNKNWLLIIDDVVEPKFVKPLLPPQLNGKVLITSQNQNWRAIGSPILVNEFPFSVAVEFLQRRTLQDKQAAELLAAKLNLLPLVLDQAASYIEATGISCKEYLRLLEQYPISDLTFSGNDQRTLSMAIGLTITRLERDAQDAAGLLKIFSFFAPKPIPGDLFVFAARELNAIIPNDITQEIQLLRTIAHLRKYSLVIDTEYGVRIHSAIQEVVRQTLATSEAKQYSELALLSGQILFHLDAGNRDQRRVLILALPHIEMAIDHAKNLGIEERLITCALGELASKYSAIGFHDLAQTILGNVQSRLTDSGEQDALFTVIQNRANVLAHLGKKEEAAELYNMSLSYFRKNGLMDSAQAAVPLNNYALFLSDNGDNIQAERIFKKALENSLKDINFSPVLRARILNNLAKNYQEQRRFKLAESTLKKSLQLRLSAKEMGPDHADTGSSYYNLAKLYESTKRYDEANKAFEQSEKIFRALGTLPDWWLAMALHQHALCLIEQGKNDHAMSLLEEGLDSTDGTNEHEFLEIRARILWALMNLKAKKGDLVTADQLGLSFVSIIDSFDFLDRGLIEGMKDYADILKLRNKPQVRDALLKLIKELLSNK